VSGEASIQTLPTIVLIGGQLKLSDGSEVDSRQSATDDKTAAALEVALTGSAAWWSTVSSVVVPTLDDSGGGFAVILGRRSIVRATWDGEPRRSVLRKVLRGTVGSVSVMRPFPGEPLPNGYRNVAHFRGGGSIGVRFDDPAPRWCFVDGNEYYLRLVANHIGARVLVDTTGEFLACAEDGIVHTGTISTIEYNALSPSQRLQMIVAPDTARIRDRIGTLLTGRPRKIPDADATAASAPYVPGAPRDPADFLRFPVLRAACKVSGLVQAGQWEDAAGLEAARMLLLKRFDLKLGLWDLALNPVLRSAVLDPVPARQAPEEVVQAPAYVRKQAEREAKKATVRREAAQRAVGEVNSALQQELAFLGWRVDRTLWNQPCLCLPLTEPLSNWPDAPERPLVILRIEVNKSRIRVVVWHSFYNDLDISAFIDDRREAFEAVARLPPFAKDRRSAVLWTASTGWGDTDADWASTARVIAEQTKRWVELLADFVASCREFHHARFENRPQLLAPEVIVPRIVGELNKQIVGYKMMVWLQCSVGEERELLMQRWALSPSAGVKIVKRIARKRGLSDSWEVITNLTSTNKGRPEFAPRRIAR
jgi:hypothetical protein